MYGVCGCLFVFGLCVFCCVIWCFVLCECVYMFGPCLVCCLSVDSVCVLCWFLLCVL